MEGGQLGGSMGVVGWDEGGWGAGWMGGLMESRSSHCITTAHRCVALFYCINTASPAILMSVKNLGHSALLETHSSPFDRLLSLAHHLMHDHLHFLVS